MSNRISKSSAIKFVILLGFVSLFADMTYEGARSISGQYLAILGASGFVVGVVAGFGELIGYGFRVISGYISDKDVSLISLIIFSLGIQLLAIPILFAVKNTKVS